MEDPAEGASRPDWPAPSEGVPPRPGGEWPSPASGWPSTLPGEWPAPAAPPHSGTGETPGEVTAREGTSGLGPNTRCYVHPDRLASAVCRSCGRPICVDCMVQAPVGWHCKRCVRRNAREAPVIRYRPGIAGLTAPGRAPITMALIAINVVMFIASSSAPSLICNGGNIPIFVASGQPQRAVCSGALIVGSGQYYRLFTSMFFHFDIVHIGLNMLSLLILGRLVEPALGKWRYLALYLVAGFGGSVASYLAGSPGELSAGASGAIFGLFGAYFILARRAALDTSWIISLIAINLVFSFTVSGIDWHDHVGGLITGGVVALGYGLSRRRRQQLVMSVLMIVCVSAVLVTLSLLPPGQLS